MSSNISKTDNNPTYSTINDLKYALDNFLFNGNTREYKVFNMDGELLKHYGTSELLETVFDGWIRQWGMKGRDLKITVNGNKVKVALGNFHYMNLNRYNN